MIHFKNTEQRRAQIAEYLASGNFCEPGFPIDDWRAVLLEEALDLPEGEEREILVEMAFTWRPADFIEWRIRCEREAQRRRTSNNG
jgi:hypothetical protein